MVALQLKKLADEGAPVDNWSAHDDSQQQEAFNVISDCIEAVAQRKAWRSRYVAPRLAGRKRLADEAGVSFRLAKSGYFQANVDYCTELQISKLKILPIYAARMTPEQLKDHDAVWAARVSEYELKRARALITQTAAQAALDQAVSLYRFARRSEDNNHENPG